MKTRWEMCNIEAQRIWLNLDLIKRPVHCLEYNIVHEMIHLLERHHNERFIAYMNRFMPLWQFYREELNRPEEEFHAFFTTGPVVAFWVDDVDEARTTMEAAGVEFISPIQRVGKMSWNHFRAPDGTVFEISSKSDDNE